MSPCFVNAKINKIIGRKGGDNMGVVSGGVVTPADICIPVGCGCFMCGIGNICPCDTGFTCYTCNYTCDAYVPPCPSEGLLNSVGN